MSEESESKSKGGKCVGENYTGGKSGVIRSSGNIVEASKRDKPQYFVDVVKDKWVTVADLNENRKRFYLVSSLLDPHTKMLSFCDNKYFPWKDDDLGFLSMEFKSLNIHPTGFRKK
jgi:hypothetical protein